MAQVLTHRLKWTEKEYLAFDENRLVEFSTCRIEALPFPTTSHQFHGYLSLRAFNAFAARRDLGPTLIAALRIRLWRGKYREPDVVFMRKEHANRIHEDW